MSKSSRRTFLAQSAGVALAVGAVSHATPADDFAAMKWLNEPAAWQRSGNRITARSKPKTDFWRTTFSRQILDNGHFMYVTMQGAFAFEGRIDGAFNAPFDQVSLMARQDEKTWIKCGMELFGGAVNSGVVATREFSDWSTTKGVVPWWRLVRGPNSIETYASVDGKDFTLMRSSYFPPAASTKVGIMCASPEGNGFDAVFDNLKLT